MKSYLFILCLLFVELAYCQKTYFPNDTRDFYDKFTDFISNDYKSKVDNIEDRFSNAYQKINDKNKYAFINSVNTLKSKKIRNKYIIYFTNTFVFLADLIGEDKLNHYLNVSNNKFVDYTSDRDIVKYIMLNNDFLSDNILIKKKPIIYKIQKNKSIDLDISYQDIVYDVNGDLIAYYNKKDGIDIIKNIEAKYYVESGLIKSKTGYLYWDKQLLEDGSYNELKGVDIKLRNNKLIIENATIFNIPKVKISNIKGKLIVNNKYFRSKDKKHIIFESYDYIDDIKFNDNIVLNGKLRLRGAVIEVYPSEKLEASLKIYRNKKNFINANSIKFIINEKNTIYSADTFVDILFGESSIYSSSVAFFYDLNKDLLEVYMKDKMPYRIFFSDTYHMIDIFLDKILWNNKQDLLYFTSRYKNIGIVSQRFYDPLVLKKFKGFNSVNTIFKISKIFKDREIEFISFDELSSALGVIKSDLVIILMELNKYGLIRLEVDKNRLKLSNKLSHLLKSKTGKYDYDQINFFIDKDKELVGQFNMDSLDLKIKGLGDVNIDNVMRIGLDVRGNDINFYKDMNFSFSGRILISHNILEGENYFFDYKNYKFVSKGNSKLILYLPISKRDNYGSYRAQRIKTPIDSVEGQLFINEANNKSSKANYPNYPYLKTEKKSYVFYDDKNIQKGLYSRDKFYLKLDTFKILKMSEVNKNILKKQFKGHFHSFPIFTVITPKIIIQKDLSIGFSTYTPQRGLKLFSNLNYKGSLKLNYQGLKGSGIISDDNLSFRSKNITFWLDSLFSLKSDVKIDKVKRKNTPSLKGNEVDVVYYPKDYSLKLFVKNPNFISIYDGKVKSKGDFTVNVGDKDIYAKGKLNYGGIEMTSSMYRFKEDYFDAKSIDLEIKDEQQNVQFRIENAFGRVDVKNRTGTFEFNDTTNNYMNFKHNNYNVFLNKIKWDIDKSKILMQNKDVKQKHLLLSTSKTTDSISFEAIKSTYDIKNKIIVSEGVDNIDVLDIIVKPFNKKVFIKENGLLERFKNSKLIIDKHNKFHTLNKVDIILNSKSKYELISANYDYVDVDSIKHPINISSLRYDRAKKQSTAYATITKNKPITLDPYFKFHGNIEIVPDLKTPIFKGFVNINNYCDDIKVGTMPINQNIYHDNIVLDTGYFKGAPIDMFLYSGVYGYGKTYKSAFISNENLLAKNKFISVNGKLAYDEAINAYTITNNRNSYPIAKVSYYQDQCMIESYGVMNFRNKNFISYDAYGKYREVMNDNNNKEFSLTIGINFFLDDIIKAIFEQLEGVDNPEISYQNESYEIAMRYINSDDDFYFEDDFKYDIALTNLKFKWDDKNKVFVSLDDNIGIHQIGGNEIGKTFKGKIVLNKTLLSDNLTIYFKTDDHYYYFKFGNKILEFYTNNKEVLKVYESIDIENRNKEIDGREYRYTKPPLSQIKSFRRKFKIK